ncbi:MAG TPA: C40 family peptidase [Gaiellaceae bacterium]|nr:C40 family peptidase [Gaiellaceae bacterium]
MRRLLLACALTALALATGTAEAGTGASRPWAAAQIEQVVAAGLMAPSLDEFRPDDPLTAGELAEALGALGADVPTADPERPVTVRELDARLVTAAGLRPAARRLRLAALAAGLRPTPWLGTETVARLLGLRVNHDRSREELELQLSEPATRAEAAYSLARLLTLTPAQVEAVRVAVQGFVLPPLTLWQREVLARALRFVGAPYVFAGTSERPQLLFGRRLPGGFDCSGFVWRVFKLEPFPGATELTAVLRGRTTYEMSGEVPAPLRVQRDALQPGDLVFFGRRGPRSRPAEVTHMGIYVGNGWMVHASDRGTTLVPLAGWYEARFAWGRNVLAEAGLS